MQCPIIRGSQVCFQSTTRELITAISFPSAQLPFYHGLFEAKQ